MLRDKRIVKELGKQGIKASDYHNYILHNPESCEKLNEQADISLKVAIKAFTKILKRRGRL